MTDTTDSAELRAVIEDITREDGLMVDALMDAMQDYAVKKVKKARVDELHRLSKARSYLEKWGPDNYTLKRLVELFPATARSKEERNDA